MREVNPMDTNRAASWELYMDAPMPMVTIFKTFDITNLMLIKEQGYKLNMLICYCIACAANQIREFTLLPVGKKMIEYDNIGVNVIVANKNGTISTCDIPFLEDLKEFHNAYLKLTGSVYQSCKDYVIEDHMIIGTSSLIKYDIDGVVNMYSGIFHNPFMIWGKYDKEDNVVKLKASFQFHHVQMDGMEACEFLKKVQECMNSLTVS